MTVEFGFENPFCIALFSCISLYSEMPTAVCNYIVNCELGVKMHFFSFANINLNRTFAWMQFSARQSTFTQKKSSSDCC